MSQYSTGTVDVTNGSAIVSGTGTTWTGNISNGDIFTVDNGVTWYEVGSVDNDTQITLTANFAEATATGQSYAITRDFTTNLSLPYPNNQDIGTAGLLRRALVEVDNYVFNDTLSAPTLGNTTLTGWLDLSNGDPIKASGVNAITFSGQDVDIANGTLTVQGNAVFSANITSVTSGEVMVYDGSEWVNNTLAEAGIAAASHTHSLADITDSGAAAALGVTGADANAVTGTAGANGNLASWNIDGDAVDAGVAASAVFTASSDVDHDATTNFVSNEHVDHSSVTITAGNALTGGGDITASRTLDVDESAINASAINNDAGFITSVSTSDIADGAVTEAKLDLNNAPTDGYVIKWNSTAGKAEWAVDETGSGGSPVKLDLGNDGSDESTDLTAINTTGDSNGIFSEPSSDELLIDVSANWPTADTANALSSAALDAIGEIDATLRSGADGTLITGTSGASGNLVEWNADGDAVDSGSSTSDFASASHTHALSDVVDWVVKTANYTASNGDGILGDTSGGSFTVTLPASPSAGEEIPFADHASSWGTNALTVNGNGNNIVGATDFTADVSDWPFSLLFNGTQWVFGSRT